VVGVGLFFSDSIYARRVKIPYEVELIREDMKKMLTKLEIREEWHDDIVFNYKTVEELESRVSEILIVIERMEQQPGISDLKMPEESRRAILQTYLRNRDSGISAETVIPRPLVDNCVSNIQAEKWLSEQPAKFRDLFIFLKGKITRISQEEFEYELERTMQEFIDSIEGRPYIVVKFRYRPTQGYSEEDVKSNDWCYDLLMEKGYAPAAEVIEMDFTVDVAEGLKKIIMGTGIYDLVIIDDASYSGKQSIGVLKQILGYTVSVENGERIEHFYPVAEEIQEDINLHILIPFTTRRMGVQIDNGLDEYHRRTGRENVKVENYLPQKIMTIEEIFNVSIAQAANSIEEDNVKQLRRLAEELFLDFEFELTLTYFQHKLVDYMCMLREFIYGAIVSEQEEEKWVKDIPFIPPTFKGPYSDAYFSMLKELENSIFRNILFGR